MLCKACLLLEGLNTDNTTLGVKKVSTISCLQSIPNLYFQTKVPVAIPTSESKCGGACACDGDEKQTVDF